MFRGIELKEMILDTAYLIKLITDHLDSPIALSATS
jgi:hypothetical protein